MSEERIKTLIEMLRSTLNNMSSANADKIVEAVIILLEEELRE